MEQAYSIQKQHGIKSQDIQVLPDKIPSSIFYLRVNLVFFEFKSHSGLPGYDCKKKVYAGLPQTYGLLSHHQRQGWLKPFRKGHSGELSWILLSPWQKPSQLFQEDPQISGLHFSVYCICVARFW